MANPRDKGMKLKKALVREIDEPRNERQAYKAMKDHVNRVKPNMKHGNDALRARAKALPAVKKTIAKAAIAGAARGGSMLARVPLPGMAKPIAAGIGIAGGLIAGAAYGAYEKNATGIQDYIDKVRTGGNQYNPNAKVKAKRK